MRLKGNFSGASYSLTGELIVSFSVDDTKGTIEELEALGNKELTIEVKQYRQKRSLNANNYFWKLCDMIAEVLGSTQDEVHDLMLYRYGVRGDFRFSKDLFRHIKQNGDFDIVQVLNETGSEIEARCWVGSRLYDTKEMARLIDGTIYEAKELGVETWDTEEVERLIKEWGK